MIEPRFITLQLKSPSYNHRYGVIYGQTRILSKDCQLRLQSLRLQSDEVGLRKSEPGYKRHHLLPVHVWELSGRHAVVQYRVRSIRA
jgi:hypothetical protein